MSKTIKNFDDRKQDWEQRFEGIIYEILQEKSENGLEFEVNFMPIARYFNEFLKTVSLDRKS